MLWSFQLCHSHLTTFLLHMEASNSHLSVFYFRKLGSLQLCDGHLTAFRNCGVAGFHWWHLHSQRFLPIDLDNKLQVQLLEIIKRLSSSVFLPQWQNLYDLGLFFNSTAYNFIRNAANHAQTMHKPCTNHAQIMHKPCTNHAQTIHTHSI